MESQQPNPMASEISEIEELRRRIERLEQLHAAELRPASPSQGKSAAPPPVPATAEVGGDAAAAVAAVAPYPQSAPPAGPRSKTSAPSLAPSPAAGVEAAPASASSLEARIGSQWLNRVGIMALLIGAAWFLKYAIARHWIGPAGRVGIGLLSGILLLAWSERFRRRGYIPFAQAIQAIGSGVLYLALWAASQLYHLAPAPAVFIGMLAVTAGNGYMAWLRDSRLLAFYALAGGFAIPWLLSNGRNQQPELFSYLFMLNLALAWLYTRKPWLRLLPVAWLATSFYGLAWTMHFYAPQELASTWFWTLAFFLLFSLSLLHSCRLANECRFPVLWLWLPFMIGLGGYVSMYLLLQGGPHDAWVSGVALGFSGYYLLLLRRAPAAAGDHVAFAVQRISVRHLILAVAFLTLAIALRARGQALTTGLLIEGAGLMLLAHRFRRRPQLRPLAAIVLLLALSAVFFSNDYAGTRVVFNPRFADYLLAIAVFGLAAWLLRGGLSQRGGASEQRAAAPDWGVIGSCCSTIAILLPVAAVSDEIHTWFWSRFLWNGPASWLANHIAAQFSYSAWFMLYGAVLLGAGFWWRRTGLRWLALGLLALAIAKVFSYDISALSPGFRVLSFMVLGVLLLAVSYAYQKNWLNLRASGMETKP